MRFTESGYHDLTVDLQDAVGTVCSVRLTAFVEAVDVTSVHEGTAITGTSVVRTWTGWVVRHPMGAARPFPLDVYTYRGERVARIDMTLDAGAMETLVPTSVAIDGRHLLVPVRTDAPAAP
jgi:hypothetical protein